MHLNPAREHHHKALSCIAGAKQDGTFCDGLVGKGLQTPAYRRRDRADRVEPAHLLRAEPRLKSHKRRSGRPRISSASASVWAMRAMPSGSSKIARATAALI